MRLSSLELVVDPLHLNVHETESNFEIDFESDDFPKTLQKYAQERRLLLPKKLSAKEFSKVLQELNTWIEQSVKNNFELPCWEKLNTHHVEAVGFGDEGAPDSKQLLSRIEKDGFIVPEKKALVIDLKRSMGPWLVSDGAKRSFVIDGLAQISTLSLGLNAPAREAMTLRPEHWNEKARPKKVEDWDIFQAYRDLLSHHSGMAHVQFANSGTEAYELCLVDAKMRYPKRRKIYAYEQSFHGRSFLALHSTYNPDKRVPFEVFKDVVEFLPFPDMEDFLNAKTQEPKNWVTLWSDAKNKNFSKKITEISNDPAADALLKKEIECLLKTKAAFDKELPLALVVEPMQCEGGDRYATPRFFRALRALTRAYDVALMIDEVQTFALGKELFWFQEWNLVNAKGQKDFPDYTWCAKRSQCGAVLSHKPWKQKIPFEMSWAGLHRGYLQVQGYLEHDAAKMESKALAYLKLLQEFLGDKVITNIRLNGFAFAFDLPNADVLNKLIAERFKFGTLFYPAGVRTARFRLFVDATGFDLEKFFCALYKCFLSLSEKTIIGDIPSFDEWCAALKKQIPEANYTHHSKQPWSRPLSTLPKAHSLEELQHLSIKDWNHVFSTLIKHIPSLLWNPWNLKFPLLKLQKTKLADLWALHEKNPLQFTKLDLLWIASRACGYQIQKATTDAVKVRLKEIDALEARVYEKERREPSSSFLKQSRNKKGIVFFAFHPQKQERLIGVCLAAPESAHSDVPTYFKKNKTKGAFYSIDLTIDPEFQSQGLGLRMKVEQILLAAQMGASVLHSRNRYPEALPMSLLNQKLGAVILHRNTKDYGGKGTGLYQSLRIPDKKFWKVYAYPFLGVGLLKNKVSLGNFVSRHYIRNLELLRDLLPKHLGHVYLSSGRGEATDKVLKLMRYQRPHATRALSFQGLVTGNTTTASTSLGGKVKSRYFDFWPVLKKTNWEKDFEKHTHNPEEIIALFVDSREPKAKLEKIIARANHKDIPVVLVENKHPYVAPSLKNKVDAIVHYPGEQLGFVAVSDRYYLAKPLMMISTWEGDEHSLELWAQKLL